MKKQWNFNQDSLDFIKKLKKIKELQFENPRLSFNEASKKADTLIDSHLYKSKIASTEGNIIYLK